MAKGKNFGIDHPYISALMFTLSLVAIIAILDYVNVGLERGLGYSAIIFASFGSSGFIMFMMPKSTAAKRGIFVKSYIVGGIIGWIGSVLLNYIGLYPSSAIVLFSMAIILYLTESEHPPAIALAFAFVLFRVGFAGIIVTAFGVILLVLSKTAEKWIYKELKV